MDRIEYLSFMIEGDYNAYLDENDMPLDEPSGLNTTMMTKSYLAPTSLKKRGDTIE